MDKQFVFAGGDKTVECRIAKGYVLEGKRGQYFGKFYCGQWWAIVQWDDEDDPDLHKVDGIEIAEKAWSKP